MLAYCSVAADREFWSKHWGGWTLEELLAVARTSPLTDLIVGALPPTGVVLEAGCGLGQYVRLLRERGWKAMGVDWSTDALATVRRASAMPLATMALTALALRSGAVTSYVSLGVVEHDPAGPDAILAEARRVLAPGGMLVISVPYVNGLRKLGAPWIRRQSRAVEAAGGEILSVRVHPRRAARRAGPSRLHVAGGASIRSGANPVDAAPARASGGGGEQWLGDPRRNAPGWRGSRVRSGRRRSACSRPDREDRAESALHRFGAKITWPYVARGCSQSVTH